MKGSEREDLAKQLSSKGLAQAVLSSGGHAQCIAYIKTIDSKFALVEGAYEADVDLMDLVIGHCNEKRVAISPADLKKIKTILDVYEVVTEAPESVEGAKSVSADTTSAKSEAVTAKK